MYCNAVSNSTNDDSACITGGRKWEGVGIIIIIIIILIIIIIIIIIIKFYFRHIYGP